MVESFTREIKDGLQEGDAVGEDEDDIRMLVMIWTRR